MTRIDSTAKKRRGEASERIISALAAEFPRMHSRQSLLRSPAILKRYNKQPGEELDENDAKAVLKTLGRLIGDKSISPRSAVSEVLLLRGRDERVNLPASGLIAVSVDITTLREEEWLRTKLTPGEIKDPSHTLRGPLLPLERKPTQEGIVEEIIARSQDWARANLLSGKLPLLVTNVSIVHGSSAFDILINVSMTEEEALLRYTREVVQRTPHVRGTQTMLVSDGYGFSDSFGSAAPSPVT